MAKDFVGNGRDYRDFQVYPFPSPDSIFPGNTSLVSAKLAFNLGNWTPQAYWKTPSVGVTFGSPAWQMLSNGQWGWPSTYSFDEFPSNGGGRPGTAPQLSWFPFNWLGCSVGRYPTSFPVQLGQNIIDVTEIFAKYLNDQPSNSGFSLALSIGSCSMISSPCELIQGANPFLIIDAK